MTMGLELPTLSTELGPIAEKIVGRERLNRSDALLLFAASDLAAVGALANGLREHMHGDRAYYIRNQHINYTNVCNKHCRFCYFAKNPSDGGPDPYRLTTDDVRSALRRHAAVPITEVHMVGGVDPRLPFSYYLDLLGVIRAERPGVHIKAFTAVELVQIALSARASVPETLQALKAHGLSSVPGGGAEILSDRVHQLLHPAKLSPSEWIDVSRQVAAAGLPQYATMLYGHVETMEERVDHLLRIRDLQDECGHFLAFTPLSFHPEGTYLNHVAGPTGWDDLRTLAVSRLVLDNVPHIKTFWIMNTIEVSQVALWFGADDIDGTVHEYEVTYQTGRLGEKAQAVTRTHLLALISEAGRIPVQRNSLYAEVSL